MLALRRNAWVSSSWTDAASSDDGRSHDARRSDPVAPGPRYVQCAAPRQAGRVSKKAPAARLLHHKSPALCQIEPAQGCATSAEAGEARGRRNQCVTHRAAAKWAKNRPEAWWRRQHERLVRSGPPVGFLGQPLVCLQAARNTSSPLARAAGGHLSACKDVVWYGVVWCGFVR